MSSSIKGALQLEISIDTLVMPTNRQVDQQQRLENQRNLYTRVDGLTDICGIASPATGWLSVEKVFRVRGTRNYCLRCDLNMIRLWAVEDKFLPCTNSLAIRRVSNIQIIQAWRRPKSVGNKVRTADAK